MKHPATAIVLVLLGLAQSASATSHLTAQAACNAGGDVVVSWQFCDAYGDPPTDDPQWYGYDIYRRATAPCGERVRITTDAIPHGAGLCDSGSFPDTPPMAGTLYEYEVLPVDAARRPHHPNTLDSMGNQFVDWASCPQSSAPIVRGVLVDWGWALYIEPCAGTCYGGFYFADPALVAELRPLAGRTDIAVDFFGTAVCGTVEGCALQVDHYQVVQCGGIVPVGHGSWGELKAIYR